MTNLITKAGSQSSSQDKIRWRMAQAHTLNRTRNALEICEALHEPIPPADFIQLPIFIFQLGHMGRRFTVPHRVERATSPYCRATCPAETMQLSKCSHQVECSRQVAGCDGRVARSTLRNFRLHLADPQSKSKPVQSNTDRHGKTNGHDHDQWQAARRRG